MQLQLKNSKIPPISIAEILIIFLLILAAMSFEIWRNVLLPFHYPLNQKIITLILQKAILTSIIITVVYRILIYILFFMIKSFSDKLFEKLPNIHDKIINFALDVFIITGLVLCVTPIRPILQDTIASSKDFYITESFARYDAFPTAIILLCFGSIIGIFIFLWQKNRYGLIKIGLIIFIIVCASMINAQPNYNAKIVEARAAWKAQNYQLLISKANEALPLTRDKNEKAVAYYWIGVACNRLDNPIEAIKYQKKAIALDPSPGYEYSSLAFAYNTLKDYKNASESAKVCIKNAPDYAWCYLAMFEYYFFAEVNMDKAEENLQLAERYAPDDREIMDTRKSFDKEKKIVREIQKKGGIVVWK